MSAKIEDLEGDVAEMARALLQLAAVSGILLRVTQTRRTMEEQEDLYAQGRTKPGNIVTHAGPGWSAHNYGRAFDVCAIGAEPYPESDAFWIKAGQIGESLGLEWGGRWKHPDRPHFQHLAGKTIAQLRAEALGRGELLA